MCCRRLCSSWKLRPHSVQLYRLAISTRDTRRTTVEILSDAANHHEKYVTYSNNQQRYDNDRVVYTNNSQF